MGQCSLPCCLACGIYIKDDVAPTLPIPDTTDGIVRPPLGKAGLLARACETLPGKDGLRSPGNDRALARWGSSARPNKAMNAASKGATR
jgi:hypothetical protein